MTEAGELEKQHTRCFTELECSTAQDGYKLKTANLQIFRELKKFFMLGCEMAVYALSLFCQALHSLVCTEVATSEAELRSLHKARHIRKKCVPMPSIDNLLSFCTSSFHCKYFAFWEASESSGVTDYRAKKKNLHTEAGSTFLQCKKSTQIYKQNIVPGGPVGWHLSTLREELFILPGKFVNYLCVGRALITMESFVCLYSR